MRGMKAFVHAVQLSFTPEVPLHQPRHIFNTAWYAADHVQHIIQHDIPKL